ncbi:hypothetical protein G4H71_11400 [Rhodococcus triatomae]|uniref:3-oxoacyl-[acyl-carrier-protein] synthase-3 n=1 Tax=Rhodococcus triatomae TaxID=300028 RepID=A0A1G8L7Z4_9NOCA|nr:hypothetical protein [Rhodococcus triatomae]QNG20521.1 hypothetical protein G4H72_18980 [Rhodococcus triatomae]QNG23561.1 hypothetical protein G4H71_11400 [Rhodococcus triatomae]SDI51390.1 3-oxoacyl-[acyl-carrier-protein] synthase-3 [Rhodococcus triatomae]
MGIVITATGISRAGDSPSIVTHAAAAAQSALAAAGIDPSRVGAVINTGVYRDSNTMEPAVAALIQKELGIGLDYSAGDRRTFAFDLMNGAVGVLNAIQVATSMLLTRSTEYVLVVSGDTHPSLTGADAPASYPYATAGAALLLTPSEEAAGFGRTFSVLSDGPSPVEGYVDLSTMGVLGRGQVTVSRTRGFEEDLLDVAVRAAGDSLRANATDQDTTLLVTSTPTPDFGDRLARRLRLQHHDRDLAAVFGRDPHTAALPAAFHLLSEDGALERYRHVLFVGAGAGPSAAATMYRVPSSVAGTVAV